VFRAAGPADRAEGDRRVHGRAFGRKARDAARRRVREWGPRALPRPPPAAADGTARAIAYLERLVGEPAPVAKEALAKDEEEGRALIADASAACHMPSLAPGQLDIEAVESVIHRPGLFAQCHWKGATANAVTMYLVIERDGVVSSAYPLAASIRVRPSSPVGRWSVAKRPSGFASSPHSSTVAFQHIGPHAGPFTSCRS
jgi:hypothetical protein